MTDDSITRTIEVAAPPERVWQALTDHREFGKWFRVDLHGPFAVGEETTGAMTYPGFEGAPWRSRTEVMEAPRRFVFRWPVPEDAPDAVWSEVAFTLEPTAAGTRLTVVESGLGALPEDKRRSVLRDNSEGWTIQTANIRDHVERG